MDLGWFGIDQAEETGEGHFFLLASRLRLRLPGIRYKGLLSANPAPGWVKSRFIEQKLEDHIFIPALPRDNPYLPEDYEANLRKIYPEELVRQLLEGDWDAVELGNYLFKYADIKRAVEREVEASEVVVMGVDIARFGDDSSVCTVRRGSRVIWVEKWAKTDLMDTTGRIIRLIERFSPDGVNLDVIGLGAGVYDRLIEQGYKITPVNVAESASDTVLTSDGKKGCDLYTNLRAEMYGSLAKRFENDEIGILDELDLVAQLSSIRYKFDSRGRLQIESKADMKKRGMKSPDKADSLGLAFLEPKLREPSIRWI